MRGRVRHFNRVGREPPTAAPLQTDSVGPGRTRMTCAWAAGAFAVLMALGGAGPEAAAGMIVLQLLANSILQQFVQPFAMGAALGIHPLAVLIVTIAGGALFGTIGLILAAPLTSAVVKISADLARARAAGEPRNRPAGPRGSGDSIGAG